jgi:Family of unknown function (DUF6338)
VFDTVAQIAFAVALILPGFIVVQLSERRRPATPPGGDLELILRGLVYALIIQAVGIIVGWLPSVVEDLTHRWQDHLDAAAAYALVMCVAAPTLIGLGFGRLLREAESAGALKWWHYALGGRDARRAWDYTFSTNDGAWMRVYFKDPGADQPVAVLGKYGTRSWASQSPAEPDLYLQEVWATDADGLVPEERFNEGSIGALWVDAGEIARLEVLPPDEGSSSA